MVGRVYQLVTNFITTIDGGVPQTVPEADMRHILGFLNQTEWIGNLNIGNIM
jgi:hypothetical protein